MLRVRPHLVALRPFGDFQRKSVVVNWNGGLSKIATHPPDPEPTFKLLKSRPSGKVVEFPILQ
jgi:hypothetical protein